MSTFIEQLQEQHRQISILLAKLRQSGLGTAPNPRDFAAARREILEHLRVEDEELYPVLREAAKTDARVQGLLELFDEGLAETTRVAVWFFAKHEGGGSGREFGSDFGKFHASLLNRLNNEESSLFAEFERLQQKR